MSMAGVTLDRTLVVLRPHEAGRDDFNAPVEAWQEMGRLFAAKRDVSDGEKLRAQQLGAVLTTRFTVRWSGLAASITPTDQLLCEGVRFGIVGKKEIGRREAFEITAQALPEAAA